MLVGDSIYWGSANVSRSTASALDILELSLNLILIPFTSRRLHCSTDEHHISAPANCWWTVLTNRQLWAALFIVGWNWGWAFVKEYECKYNSHQGNFPAMWRTMYVWTWHRTVHYNRVHVYTKHHILYMAIVVSSINLVLLGEDKKSNFAPMINRHHCILSWASRFMWAL